ncbi:hypothetical protein PAF17_03840 [Paracoccus sp. Z330]|uniref:DUF2244 domain-containing protein n=1 Tax=Paracoccus onchidii TaxID=3017813 RepID=A0ABT4ZB98_9RHOB|nr:hypothetical protein [Paracoccus onchidii]MDB6176634.1 hypothetical protein [Paracoccus onchidii]
MIREPVRQMMSRWGEILAGLAIMLGGGWLIWLGGWFCLVIGGVVVLVALALLIGAWRRLPFRRDIAAPGLVEVVEGAVRYFGATQMGGEIALRDLVEIRLLRLDGRGHWRLRSAGGEALLIPVDAAGADALAHAFTALPGLQMGAVSNALAHVAEQSDAMHTVWRRDA